MGNFNTGNAWRGTPYLMQGQNQNGSIDFSYNPMNALGNTSPMDMQSNNLYDFSNAMNTAQAFTPDWNSLSKSFDNPNIDFMTDSNTMFSSPNGGSIFDSMPDWMNMDNFKTGMSILQAYGNFVNSNRNLDRADRAADAQIAGQKATINNNATELARIAQNRAEYEAANLAGHDYKSDAYNQQVNNYNKNNQYERLG